jgi:hypothetical protein
MTGPEHYQMAERLLANRPDCQGDGTSEADQIAAAQVHATLAVAAAAAIGSPDLPSGDWDDWRFVASTARTARAASRAARGR